MTASTLVTEEVGDRGEGSVVGTSLLSLLELLIDEVSNELFSLDMGELDATLELSLGKKLKLHEIGKSLIKRVGPGSQLLFSDFLMLVHVLTKLLKLLNAGDTLLEDLVKLSNEVLEGTDERQETFRDEDATVVLASGSSLLADVSYFLYNVGESLMSSSAFLRNKDDVGLGLESALHGEVGRLSTHKSDKVPVLDGGSGVSKHITNELTVNL